MIAGFLVTFGVPWFGDQVRVVVAGLPGIGGSRALEEPSQKIRVARTGMYLPGNVQPKIVGSEMIAGQPSDYRGDDKLLAGIILGVVAFWLFAQTTLNIAPIDGDRSRTIATNVMNICRLDHGPVDLIVVIGGLRVSVHPRDSGRRARRGARERPGRDRESRSDSARGVWRQHCDVPGTELSG